MAGIVGQTRLEKECEAAWQAYASACRLGGSPVERSAAYERARAAQERLWRVQDAELEGR
jgi:hypothetical protein